MCVYVLCSCVCVCVLARYFYLKFKEQIFICCQSLSLCVFSKSKVMHFHTLVSIGLCVVCAVCAWGAGGRSDGPHFIYEL